jgi:hypothetical protein
MSPAEREQKLIESKRELIENPGSICRFTVNKNYREVYQISKAGMLDAGMPPDAIKGELNTDIEQAEITIEAIGIFDAATIMHTEIKALSPETSDYTEFYFYKWKYKQHHERHCAELKQFIEKGGDLEKHPASKL